MADWVTILPLFMRLPMVLWLYDYLEDSLMSEVLKFKDNGEFLNRVRIPLTEVPVLGLDGKLYSYENKENKSIIRKYEPGTLP